jgi:RNA polymerase sigma-70 factor (ECF subfamily)
VTLEGSRPDFAEIIAANYQRVYNVILRLVDDREEAADLTQDTFVNACRAYDNFRHESQVYTWLYRIAINLTKNRLERRGRQRMVEGVSVDAPLEMSEQEELFRQIEDWRGDPDRIAANQELKRFVAEQVGRLRGDYKEVIVLRDYQGLSYEEIADVLGCSVQAVKSRLFRARSVLRDRLSRYLFGTAPAGPTQGEVP